MDRSGLLAGWLSLAAAVAWTSSLSIDRFWLGMQPLAETSPAWGPAYLGKCALALTGGVLLVGALALLDRGAPAIDWANWGHLSWTPADRRDVRGASAAAKQVAVGVAYLLSAGFTLLFLWRPRGFYLLAREDGVIESLSALVCFVTCAIFVRSFVELSRNRSVGWIRALPAVGLAAVMFLIGMEEVSWFQRALGFETPELFGANLQKEMNLHNLATAEFENLYYGVTFLFLVVLPFVRERVAARTWGRYFASWIPDRTVVPFAALAAPYNYDMWNVLPIQAAFFTSAGAAGVLLWRPGTPRLLKAAPWAILATQGLFLLLGTRFVREWDVTEYKELFIPVALLVYAVGLLSENEWGPVDSRS